MPTLNLAFYRQVSVSKPHNSYRVGDPYLEVLRLLVLFPITGSHFDLSAEAAIGYPRSLITIYVSSLGAKRLKISKSENLRAVPTQAKHGPHATAVKCRSDMMTLVHNGVALDCLSEDHKLDLQPIPRQTTLGAVTLSCVIGEKHPGHHLASLPSHSGHFRASRRNS